MRDVWPGFKDSSRWATNSGVLRLTSFESGAPIEKEPSRHTFEMELSDDG